MGYDATIYISKNKASLLDIDELLTLLNYKKNKNTYRFYVDDNYKYNCSIFINKQKDTKNEYVFTLRTQIWASGYDLRKINQTLRCLKKYCKAIFYTDEGKNKYYEEGLCIKKAEAGCYYAIDELLNHFSIIENAVNAFPKETNAISKVMSSFDIASPSSMNASIYNTYLCSIIEEYFRSTYIALLKYSNKKASILKNKKIYDLQSVLDGVLSFEEGYAQSISFENIDNICKNFADLYPGLDIGSALKKPYHRRKKNLYSTIDDIIKRRHNAVHHLDFDAKYNSDCLIKDINDTKEAVKRVYKYICKIYGWKSRNVVL